MKKHIATLLFATFTLSAQAQIQTTSRSSRLLNMILARQSANAAAVAKTTDIHERLIAQSNYGIDILDSFAYKYNSDARGSVFHQGDANYNQSAYFPVYSPNALFGYIEANGIVPSYAGQQVFYDTAAVFSLDLFAQTFMQTSFRTFSYNTGNAIQSSASYSASQLSSNTQSVYTYDAESRLASLLDMSMQPGSSLPWDSLTYGVFTYNSQGWLAEDSVSMNGSGAWMPQTRYTYSYNSNGAFDVISVYSWSQAGWLPEESYTMTYYPDNKLKTYLYNNAGIDSHPHHIDSMGYTAGIAFPTFHELRSYDADTLNSMDREFVQANAAGNVDTTRSYSYGTGSTVTGYGLEFIQYDAYNLPMVVTSYSDTLPITPATQNPYRIYYYYEPYNATAISNTSAVTGNIAIYPNPATGKIYIAQKAALKIAAVTINITNASGLCVISQSIPWDNQAAEVSLSSLAPGIYLVTIQDESGRLLHRQSVVKR